MITILRKEQEFYIMSDNIYVFGGDLSDTVLFLRGYGILNIEIEDGLVSLIVNEHSKAYYGINHTFIRSE